MNLSFEPQTFFHLPKTFCHLQSLPTHFKGRTLSGTVKHSSPKPLPDLLVLILKALVRVFRVFAKKRGARSAPSRTQQRGLLYTEWYDVVTTLARTSHMRRRDAYTPP